MKKFKAIYIIGLVLLTLNSNSQTAGFTVNDSILISSLSVRCIADERDSLDYTFLWDFDDGATSTDSVVNHTYTNAGSYIITLRVTPEVGPFVEHDTTITIVDAILNIPNVFTPNDDGVNDFFIVQSDGNRLINIQIFSRKGVLVYKNEAPLIAWDGRNLSGTQVSPGVYYYIVTTSDNSIEDRTGFLQLFR